MMKKAIFTAIFLVFSLNMGNFEEEPGIIASFNSLHLGWKGKNYEKTAEILQKYDLIGLQEVMKPIGVQLLSEKLRDLTKTLWKYHISEKKVGTARYKEYYAYIWQAEKVTLVRSLGFYDEIKNSDFIREPYGCIFRIGKFDFTFVLCHLLFSTKKARREEAKRLPGVYEFFQNKNGDEQDVIIAGDFNLPSNDKSFDTLYQHPDEIIYGVHHLEKTTLGKGGSLASSYDNFFFSSRFTREIICIYVDDYFEHIDISSKEARKGVSDHLPIFFLSYTEKDDD